jgi:hypothetical protein
LVKVTKKNKFTVFLMDILVAYKSLWIVLIALL